MMKDDRWCNCIALHDFDIKDVKWQECFDFALSIFTKHKLEPTRISIQGKHYGYSAKTLTFKGGLRKLEKYSFEAVESICFMAMSSKDDYTTNFIIDASIYPDARNSKQSNVSLCIDEKLEPFNKVEFVKIAKTFHNFCRAKYGYYYRRHLKHEPGMYVVGGNNYFPTREDDELCHQWERKYYFKDSGYRTGHLRNIYKLNFLSREHLHWQVTDEHTLESWIALNPAYGKLEEVSSNFWSWYVDEEQIHIIKQLLIPSGIILCFLDPDNPYPHRFRLFEPEYD